MASWDGGDAIRDDADFIHPPQAAQFRIPEVPDPSSIHPDTERNVQAQTEDIVTNYMYQQYRQVKMRQQFDSQPSIPEFQVMGDKPVNKTAQIGRQLARIGDEIQDRYADEFDGMIHNLRIDKDNIYETFTNVAKKMIASGLSWGRIVALLSFGFRMAMNAFQNNIAQIPGFLHMIVQTIGQVFVQERISKWIADNGGWIAALTFNASASNLAMAVVGITALTSVVAVLCYRTFA